jgi:hypothetical protein
MNNSEKHSTGSLLPVLIGGCVFFLLYGTLAMLFYNERLAFDASHYLVELINTKAPFVAHGRYIGVMSQLLPLVGIYLHLSLETLKQLYSIGDVLYYFTLFLLILLYFKDSSNGLALILTLCISACFTFYCPVSELLQGLALLCLWNAMLYCNFPYKPLFIILVLFLLLTAHPLMFIPVGFVLIRYLLSKNTFSGDYLLMGFYLGITILKFVTLDTYDYQKAFYPIVFKDYSALGNLSDLRYIGSFIKMLFVEQTAVIVMLLLTLFFGLRQRKPIKMLLTFSAVVFFLLVIIATHRFTGLSNYSERMLLPLSSIVVIAFVDVLMRESKLIKRVGLLLCTALVLFRLEVIHLSGRPYVLRLEQLNELIGQAQTLGLSKVIVEDDKLEQVSFAYTGWCVPLETMLLSSTNNRTTISMAMQKEHIQRIKESNRHVADNQWIKWTEIILLDKNLSQEYFRMKSGKYDSLLTYNDNCTSDLTLEIDSLVRRSDDEDVCLKLRINSSVPKRISAGNLKVAFLTTNSNNLLSNSKEVWINSDFINSKNQLFEMNFAEKGTWNYTAWLTCNQDTLSSISGIFDLDNRK